MNNSDPSLLHILIITYNRASFLKRTLDQILPALGDQFLVTVFDNCSTDSTAEICAGFGSRIETVRHPINIGFGANYLRTVEKSRGEYTWILCDDDMYDFSILPRILSVLKDKKPCFAYVGEYDADDSFERGICLPAARWTTVPSVASHIGFVPAVIFRTEAVASEDLSLAYKWIGSLFPQVALYGGILRRFQNADCYLAESFLVKRSAPAEHGMPPFTVLCGLFVTCSVISNACIRHALQKESVWGDYFRVFAFCAFREKLDWEVPLLLNWLRLLYFAPLEAKIGILLIFPFVVLPRNVLIWFRKIYRKINYDLMGKPLPEDFHLKKSRDILRY